MKHVICLGSSHGGDRVGWDIGAALERRLARCGRTDVRVRICSTPAHLPAMLPGATQVLIVDALAGVPAGTVRSVAPEELQSASSRSTHGVDVMTALGLARALGDLPADVRILGIGIGDPACAVEAGDRRCVEAVLATVWDKMIELFGPL